VRGSAQAALVHRILDVVDTGLPALLPPEKVVLGQDPPAAAGLCGARQVTWGQEAQHVQRQLLGQERDEVALELGLDDGHHVANLGRLA